MTNIIIYSLVLIVAITMTMVGKGGGNFYVVILAIASIPMHQAATTGQFILFSASLAAMFVFHKNKSVSWALVFLIGSFTSLSALLGGYFSGVFSDYILKMIFAIMLFISGAIMLIPVKENKGNLDLKNSFGIIKIKSGDDIYRINLFLAIPITILTGFASGMVGVSGGSFLVPLMVVAFGVSMHIAVGTASSLIMAISLMGFTGHAIHGDFNPKLAIPLAVVTIVGGIIGGKFALKSKPKNLKKLFAYTNWFAALFMLYNMFSK